jgi:hypothetical protein
MRLNSYINETSEKFINQYLQILNDECKPFLKLIKDTDFLYRGVNHAQTIPIKKFMHDEGRIPLSTPLTVHNELNKIFKKKFGWPVRDGVFCTFKPALTMMYGKPYFVFGIGDFKYCYSKEITDLWTDLDHWATKKKITGDEDYDFSNAYYLKKSEVLPKHKIFLNKFVDTFYTDEKLTKINNEISFNFPDGYYLVEYISDAQFLDGIKDLVENS